MTETKSWHEEDEFWQLYEEVFFSPKKIETAEKEVGPILELTQTEPGSTVLDLCCGIGRHTIELARQGLKVTAVDRTGPYLDRARKRAEEAGVEIEFIHGDMREFSRPDTFDLILNMYTSFGYFEDPSDDLKAARNIVKSLKPGGRLILDTLGKEILARIFDQRSWDRVGDVVCVQERRVTQCWSWIENEWALIKDDKIYRHNVSHRLFAGTELARLFRDAGAGQTECFGNLDGEPYDHKASRLVLVARK